MECLSAEPEVSSIEDNCWLNKHVRRILEAACPQVANADPNNRSDFARCVILSLLYVFISKMKNHFPESAVFTKMIASVKHMFQRLQACASNAEIMEYVSYFTCKDFHKAVKSLEDPAIRPKHVSDDDVLYSGFLRKYVGVAHARRDIPFFSSLLQCKRVWPKIPLAKCQTTLESNRSNLCDMELEPLNPRTVIWIYRTVYNLAVKNVNINTTKFCPSMSACLERKVWQGGCGALFEPLVLPTHDERKKAYGISPGSGRPYPINPQMSWAFFEEHRFAQFESAREMSRTMFESEHPGAITNIKLLFEPGKARIIGVEDGHHSSYIQPLQGAMLDMWKSSPHTTMVDDLDSLIYEHCDGSSLPICLSIDYKSATDTMNPAACAHGLNAFLSVIDVSQSGISRNEMLEDFISSYLVYPIGEVVVDPETLRKRLHEFDLGVGVQQNGQRMGSRKSFPVLCVVNLAGFCAALEEFLEVSELQYNTTCRVRNGVMRSLFVNGDDLSALVPLTFYATIKKYVSNIGWKLSPGKSYYSRDFLQINSRNYVRRIERPHVLECEDEGSRNSRSILSPRRLLGDPQFQFRRSGYLNMKLVSGFNLKNGGAADADPEQLGRDLSEMVSLCPWTEVALAKAMARFGKRFRIFQGNWFLPVHMGGYGIDPRHCEKEEIRISYEQRVMAAKMISDPSLHLTTKVSRELYKQMKLPLDQREIIEKELESQVERTVRSFTPSLRFVGRNYDPKMVEYLEIEGENYWDVHKLEQSVSLSNYPTNSPTYFNEDGEGMGFNSLEDCEVRDRMIWHGSFGNIDGKIVYFPTEDESWSLEVHEGDGLKILQLEELLDDNFVAKLSLLVRWSIINEPLPETVKKFHDHRRRWLSCKPATDKFILEHWEARLIGRTAEKLPALRNMPGYLYKGVEKEQPMAELSFPEYYSLPAQERAEYDRLKGLEFRRKGKYGEEQPFITFSEFYLKFCLKVEDFLSLRLCEKTPELQEIFDEANRENVEEWNERIEKFNKFLDRVDACREKGGVILNRKLLEERGIRVFEKPDEILKRLRAELLPPIKLV